MILPEKKGLRVGLLIIVNLTILFVLIIGSVLFQFVALGWGASANSPNFNPDIALFIYLILVGFLSHYQKNKENKLEIIFICILVTIIYLVLRIFSF